MNVRSDSDYKPAEANNDLTPEIKQQADKATERIKGTSPDKETLPDNTPKDSLAKYPVSQEQGKDTQAEQDKSPQPSKNDLDRWEDDGGR